MKLEDACQVEEAENTKDANKFMSQGYKLIKIFHKREETSDGVTGTVVYVLGLPRKEK